MSPRSPLMADEAARLRPEAVGSCGKLWRAMTRWKEAVGENPLGSVAGIVRVWQEWLIRDETLFLLRKGE